MTQTAVPALQPPNSTVSIRPVRFQDVEALQRNCWPERDADSIYGFIGRVRQAAKLKRGTGAVVLGPTDEAIGYGQGMLWPRCAEVSDLIIAPGYRRQGLGTALIQYLVRAIRDLNADCVDIGAALSNPGAVSLYRRLGFRDSYTQMVALNGTDEEVLYLRIKFPKQPD
ncbi:MAG: GNAT family N-acetyltransferase [Anaerolineae bacterium]|nr:GNAT family N-acetyltransferase [Anaerolineae bacterium]